MTARLRQLVRLAAPVAVLLIGLVAAPSASAGNPCFHDFAMPAADSGTGTEVKLLPCAFSPTVTRVAVGAAVTFVNGSEFSHLVTGANQGWGSPEAELQPGQKVSYTFDAAGIYPYACVLHPGMSGAIVVGDVSAAAPGAGTTSGGSTDASTGGGSSLLEAPAVAAQATAPNGFVLAGLGMVAGLAVGVAATWIVLRRQTTASRRLPSAQKRPILGDPS